VRNWEREETEIGGRRNPIHHGFGGSAPVEPKDTISGRIFGGGAESSPAEPQ
jgi:hypothetical protein